MKILTLPIYLSLKFKDIISDMLLLKLMCKTLVKVASSQKDIRFFVLIFHFIYNKVSALDWKFLLKFEFWRTFHVAQPYKSAPKFKFQKKYPL